MKWRKKKVLTMIKASSRRRRGHRLSCFVSEWSRLWLEEECEWSLSSPECVSQRRWERWEPHSSPSSSSISSSSSCIISRSSCALSRYYKVILTGKAIPKFHPYQGRFLRVPFVQPSLYNPCHPRDAWLQAATTSQCGGGITSLFLQDSIANFAVSSSTPGTRCCTSWI